MSGVLARGLACALLLAGIASAAAAERPLAPWKGGATPALALKDLDGQVRDIAGFRGRVVVVNFWATWCEPCRDELPSLNRLREHFAGVPFEVLAVDVGEGEARIREFLVKTPVTFPVLLDRDSVAQKAWGIRGLPASFILDPGGQIRYSFLGQRDWADDEVKAAVRSLLP